MAPGTCDVATTDGKLVNLASGNGGGRSAFALGTLKSHAKPAAFCPSLLFALSSSLADGQHGQQWYGARLPMSHLLQVWKGAVTPPSPLLPPLPRREPSCPSLALRGQGGTGSVQPREPGQRRPPPHLLVAGEA